MIEEYNARTNVLSVSEITLINDSEIQIMRLEAGEIKVFKKVK